MPFTTGEAFRAQRLLHDLVLTPRDPLQLHAQTLLNKYNMHPDDARTLASQKLKTEFGAILAAAVVKRDPVEVPEEPAPEEEPPEELAKEPTPPPPKPGAKAAGKPDPKGALGKAASKKGVVPPPVEEPEEEPEKEKMDDKLTEADRTGNIRSTWRALDKPLWLLVQDGYDLGGNQNDTWRLPHAEFIPGENIRQTAERAVVEATSGGIDVFYELDSPCAHLVAPTGDYLFFVRATIKGGKNGRPMDKVEFDLGPGLKDYAWVSQDDLPNYITDKGLLDIVTKLCI